MRTWWKDSGEPFNFSQTLDEIEQAVTSDENPTPATKKELNMAVKKKVAAAVEAPPAPEPKAAVVEGYSVADLAAEFELEASALRQHLRALEIEKPGARWVWPKKTDAGLVEIRKQVKERLESLAKAGEGKEKAEPAAPAKAALKKKVSAKA